MTALTFLRYWKFVAIGILIAVLGIQTMRMHSAHVEASTAKQNSARMLADLKAQTLSIHGLLAVIDAANAATEARGKAYDDAAARNAKDVAAADARAKAALATVERLRVVAQGNGGCDVPAALRADLRGL